MKPSRTLSTIYWDDEGDSAVRWLIGEINYGPHDSTRDRLRQSPLEEVKEWAQHTGNIHLQELAEQVLAGGVLESISMNPHLGPNDRLAAVCGAGLLANLSQSMPIIGGRSRGGQASFEVFVGESVIDVVVSPSITTARIRGAESAIVWGTELGSAGTRNIIDLARGGS